LEGNHFKAFCIFLAIIQVSQSAPRRLQWTIIWHNQYWTFVAPIDDPQIAEFVAQLDTINSLPKHRPLRGG